MLLLQLTSPAAQVVARAGGGQGFGGGGGGSGGGGGNGNGNGNGFFLLSLLLYGNGLGFVGLLVVLGIYMLVSRLTHGGSGFGALFSLFGMGGLFGMGRGGPAPIPPAGGYGGVPGDNPPPANRAAYGPGTYNPAAYGPGAAGAGPGGYDDTHPIGVPDRFRGSMLEGSHPEAHSGAGGTLQDGVGAITAHDPAFDPAAFVSQTQTSFFIIQQAWSQAKPELSRSVMADGLAQQFAFQMEDYQRKGQRNMLDGLTVGHADVIAAHSDPSFDTVTVRFQAASADYDVDVNSGHVVRGHKDIQNWAEDWIFQRSAQAVTKPGEGTMNRKCPNCQAPISITAEGTCEYCHAQVMSGKYDWVLARIDQVQPAYT